MILTGIRNKMLSPQEIYQIPDELQIQFPIDPAALEQVYMIVQNIYNEFSPEERENIKLWKPKLYAIIAPSLRRMINSMFYEQGLQPCIAAALKIIAADIILWARADAESMGLHAVTEESLINTVRTNWPLKAIAVFIDMPFRKSGRRHTTT